MIQLNSVIENGDSYVGAARAQLPSFRSVHIQIHHPPRLSHVVQGPLAREEGVVGDVSPAAGHEEVGFRPLDLGKARQGVRFRKHRESVTPPGFHSHVRTSHERYGAVNVDKDRIPVRGGYAIREIDEDAWRHSQRQTGPVENGQLQLQLRTS